jgi:hypothetical protein
MEAGSSSGRREENVVPKEMRQLARRRAFEFLEQQAGALLSDEQAMELALEAQRWARAEARKPRRDRRQPGAGRSRTP